MKIENITKSYGKTEVLKDISLEIKTGEKIALLGSNGTGKSTLMNIINQSLAPTSGKISYGEMHLTPENTGYIMQNMTLPSDARGIEIMRLFAHDKIAVAKGAELVKNFRMTDFITRKISQLSGGQKQKLFLISALQNQPDYFFLDEITTGLDSESRTELFEFLSENDAVKQATTVLVTHYMEEALQLCERFIILKDGKIAADLTKNDLISDEFSEIIFDRPVKKFDNYLIADKTYKLPKNMAEEILTDLSKNIVSYKRDFTLDLEGLLS
ncbi:ABC transporter ATP-binding protein [Lactococcus nasutitermitis]|uniref:ABC transporter ATP-binding protein n=1 Tax=Lactococcus nasutitermitis TaxID=1652957 RepID=A0ABV9JAK7_9LACT|nr:ABC transporter ATP-binding protein [Lactococcus nasutitermitis]